MAELTGHLTGHLTRQLSGHLAGQGDPETSIRLLWRAEAPTPSPPRRPGRPPGLTVGAIVDTAIATADEVGVTGTSMRVVADRLGVTAMALYTYVPGKAELVDLMYDRMHAELPRSYDASGGWRTALARWADDLLALYLRHPWVSQVSFARAVLGPHEQAVLETLVGILRRTGLRPGLLRRIVTTLFHLARGTAQTVAGARLADTAGTTERAWWSRRTAALLAVVPDFAQEFPLSTWLVRESTDHAPEVGDESSTYVEREAMQAFRAGLNILLDGIAVAIGDAAPRAPADPGSAR